MEKGRKPLRRAERVLFCVRAKTGAVLVVAAGNGGGTAVALM